jgi:hypothetical protein
METIQHFPMERWNLHVQAMCRMMGAAQFSLFMFAAYQMRDDGIYFFVLAILIIPVMALIVWSWYRAGKGDVRVGPAGLAVHSRIGAQDFSRGRILPRWEG